MLGKQLPLHLYIHKAYIPQLPEDVKVLVSAALEVAGEFNYDILKIAKDRSHVCLLSYPGFYTNAHPSLKYSIRVMFPKGQYCITNFAHSDNPPILHRKDAFIMDTNPHYLKFKALTDAEDEYGLLSRSDIGHLKQWEALLESKNLAIHGHTLAERG